MKIYDCFLFYNELDVLQIRLKELYDKVDYFVLVEQDTTHQGKAKESLYLQHKNLFAWAEDKIIHHICSGIRIEGQATHQQALINENAHRNALNIVLNYANNNNDIIIISDVDEIPILESDIITPGISLCQWYTYNFNTLVLEGWRGSVFLRKDNLEHQTAQYWRDRRPDLPIVSGGWHLSYFGDATHIRNKLKSFCHPEVNNDRSLLNLENHINNGTDFLGWFRNCKFASVDTELQKLPQEVLNNKDKYKRYFK